MCHDELFRDGEPEPAVGAFTARSVAAPEAVEDEGDVFGGDARACVLNRNAYCVLCIVRGFGDDGNCPAFGRVTQRVREEIR